jgi:tetratricopeptide (TPR) repeat protein
MSIPPPDRPDEASPLPRSPSGARDPRWVEPGDDGGADAPGEPGGVPPPPRAGSSRTVQMVALIGVLIVALAAALLYRAHHRRQVLAKGMARASELLRSDTYAGYLAASQVLEPLVAIEPVEAGSLRALALAMLAADYRDERAGAEAERLLDAPERAAEVPPPASLARAALAMGRRQAGSAATSAARAGTSAFGRVIQGRVALAAGNPSGAAGFAAEAVAAEPGMPAALALQGDALRRSGNAAAARLAYLGALEASPLHPRAAYGMAKLALSGKARPEEAWPALERILADREGTPSNERARAALHLAALQGRAGDRAGAQRTLDSSGVSGADRTWLEKAVAEEELARGGYRVVDGAPAGLLSASDDDPYVAPPPAPPEPVRKVEKKSKATKKAPKKGKTTSKSKSKKSPTKSRAQKPHRGTRR